MNLIKQESQQISNHFHEISDRITIPVSRLTNQMDGIDSSEFEQREKMIFGKRRKNFTP